LKKINLGGIGNSEVGWKMRKQLQPWQGARLDFEPLQYMYVRARALRGEDGEAHLKRTVEVAVKQSQAAEPQPSRNSTLTPGTSPNPRTATSRTEPAPEAAPNLIWAETPNLTLLGKNNTY